MANLRDDNRHNPRLRVNMDEYWDFVVCHDGFDPYVIADSEICDSNLISYIDWKDESCIEGDDWVYSKSAYSWENALSISGTMENIGYTGIDNGLIKYRKDRILNKDFFEIFQTSTYDIIEDDFRLKLHAVSGTTLLYDYPLHVGDGYVKLNGGFYQGFYKTECDKYYILPSKLDIGDTWGFEFTMKKCDLEPESKKTLNDKYPDNKGIFFYMGTRAENKWVYLYKPNDDEECFALSPDDYVEDAEIDKEEYIIKAMVDPNPDFVEEILDLDDYLDFDYYVDGKVVEHIDGWCCDAEERESYHLECRRKQCGCPKVCRKVKDKTSDDNNGYLFNCDIFGEEYIDGLDALECDFDFIETDLDISYFEYETNNGFKLSSSNDYYFYTDNKFMLFDRTPDGYNIKNYEEGTMMMYHGKKNKFKGNLFILMNRTQTGYTINTIKDVIDEANSQYDSFYKDLYNNVFALRIKDDGSIGYRYLIYDCDEAKEDENYKYTIKEGYSNEGVIPDCEWFTVHVKVEGHGKTMRLLFYVNGKLVYITEEMQKFNFRELDEIPEKQEGVPYNISLGGGSQGLAETIIRNYMLNPTRTYPIEKYFAGTFIGYMKSFRFYDSSLDYNCIVNNFNLES